MYQPKLKDELVQRVYQLSQETGLKMTIILNLIVEKYFADKAAGKVVHLVVPVRNTTGHRR